MIFLIYNLGMGKEFLWKPSLEIEMQVAKEGDSNFPEMLKTVICINCEYIFFCNSNNVISNAI